jgi:hypothetical protein
MAVEIEADSIAMVVGAARMETVVHYIGAARSMAVGVAQIVKGGRTVLEGFDIAAERTAAVAERTAAVAFNTNSYKIAAV